MTNHSSPPEHDIIGAPWHAAKCHAVPHGTCYSSKIRLLDSEREEESSGHMVIVMRHEEGIIRTDMYGLLVGCEPIKDDKGTIILDRLVHGIRKEYPGNSDENELVHALQTEIEQLYREAMRRLPLLPEYGNRKTYPWESWKANDDGTGYRTLKTLKRT